MSNVKYIIANYLKILNIEDGTISQILLYLERHSYYPSLRSISDIFDEWQFINIASKIDERRMKELGGFFMAHLTTGEGSFILVLTVEDTWITYLNDSGEIIRESYNDFKQKWDGVIFIAETGEYSGQRKKTSRDDIIFKVGISDIKKAGLNQEEPVTYKFFRLFSAYFSFFFIQLKIPPTVITFLWLISLLTASYLFFINGSDLIRISAAFLICLHYILDCSDGEVARVTNKSSKAGSNLEQVVHWTTNLCLIAGISAGLYKMNYPNAMILGLGCLLGDSCFHFFYIQLNYWIDKTTDYGMFHHVTKIIYHLMPVNINLFLIGALCNQLCISLWIWTVLSFFLFILLAFLFFKKEFSFSRD